MTSSYLTQICRVKSKIASSTLLATEQQLSEHLLAQLRPSSSVNSSDPCFLSRTQVQILFHLFTLNPAGCGSVSVNPKLSPQDCVPDSCQCSAAVGQAKYLIYLLNVHSASCLAMKMLLSASQRHLASYETRCSCKEAKNFFIGFDASVKCWMNLERSSCIPSVFLCYFACFFEFFIWGV